MKKLLYLLLFSSVALASCVQDVDDVYDKPVAVRLEEAVQEYRDLLESSPNGWLMEYYPHSSQKYGGYSFAMKFGANDEVTIQTEAFGQPERAVTSLFSVKKDMGPTLNFDTYNDLFHFFSDPDMYEAGGTGKGYEGDYEFQLLSHTDNEILLRGKKTNNRIRMVRLDESPTAVMSAINEVGKEFAAIRALEGFKGTMDGTELNLEKAIDGRYFTITYGDETVSAPYLLTATGIQLYQPVTVGGREFYHFTFSEENGGTLMPANESDITLTAITDPSYLFYDEYLGTFDLAFDNQVMEVTIEPREEGKSFLIKGLPHFDIVMKYNQINGRAYIYSQKVTTENGRDIWICGWDTDQGQLSWNTNIGLETTWNMDTDNFVLTFRDFGSWAGFVVKGFYYYSFDAGGLGNGAFFSDWGGNYFCGALNTLTKK